MKKAIVWGTELKAVRLFHYLNLDEVDIIGFTDNSGKTEIITDFMFNRPYLPIKEAIQQEVDFFVIASSAYCEITNQLVSYGITRERIIQAYNVQFMIPDTLYYYNDIETDDSKYKIFSSLESYSCKLV